MSSTYSATVGINVPYGASWCRSPNQESGDTAAPQKISFPRSTDNIEPTSGAPIHQWLSTQEDRPNRQPQARLIAWGLIVVTVFMSNLCTVDLFSFEILIRLVSSQAPLDKDGKLCTQYSVHGTRPDSGCHYVPASATTSTYNVTRLGIQAQSAI